jgi:outer membrane biosynthesis protein TonB
VEGRSPPDRSVIPNDRATVKVGVGRQPFPLPPAVAYAKFTPMAAPSAQLSRTHGSRPDTSRLVLALVISLALHLTSYGVYEGGKALHLWEKLHTPVWFKKLMEAVTPKKAIEVAKQPDQPREAPLMFVDVNPALASAEPPKDAKYYAAQSTRASNPDAEKETDVPKISGEQEKVMKTENTERVKPQPLQPALPPEPPVEEVRPKATLRPGDLTMAKPDESTRKGEGDSPKPRPRTIAEARAQLAQQQPLKTAGQRAKQEGGVRNRNVTSTLDAIGSPFGMYDAAVVAAIQNRWFDLLDERGYASDKTGKVVLEFHLHYDGRITELKVVEHSVDEILSLLCQKAILDPSPYAPWPSDMRRRAGADFREVRFTFYYN